jgi:hypothetical protein
MHMARVLEEFWYGNINPAEKLFTRNTEFEHLLKLLCKNEEKLLSSLNESEKETFQKYQECQRVISQISECEVFTEGLKLGLKIMAEAYSDDGIFKNLT